jgi:hypothetical protein
MRTLIAATAAALLLLLTIVIPIAGREGTTTEHRVTICHVPPGNPDAAHSITIDKHALQAHLGDNEEGLHGGDYYGPCLTPKPTPTPSTEASSTPTPEVSPSEML